MRKMFDLFNNKTGCFELYRQNIVSIDTQINFDYEENRLGIYIEIAVYLNSYRHFLTQVGFIGCLSGAWSADN